MPARLERSRSNRVIGGVCGGLAEYLDIDPTIVRVGMVILGAGGVGILVYFVLLVLMPNPGEPAPFTGAAGGVATTTTFTDDPLVHERRRSSLGLLLVAIGTIFLLGNLGFFRFVDLRAVWPLVLIALGVFFIAQRSRP